MSEELKERTKKFALDVVGLCAGLPQVLETRHAIGPVIRSSSSVAANYRAACRGLKLDGRTSHELAPLLDEASFAELLARAEEPR